ncbi:hypothetical protein CHS0354_009885 [Potamilus streckersoni]|uniref:Uncharacterized protein n=1 Tax=Potamilus streckersoni TaxID=2493646 RepID=A0AAE0S437_9BIVA|nr:hypothetical protein CHS0354_009885 [Potamilus streckersoni]
MFCKDHKQADGPESPPITRTEWIRGLSVERGNVRIGDRDYELQPAKTNVETRYLLEGKDIRGLQYVLQHQTHNQGEYAAEKKGL